MRLTSKPSLRRACTVRGTGGDWNGREILHATRWLATALLLVLSLAPAHASRDCPAEVVGYWPLDGDGTERVNGFPGTLVGNATFVPGVVGLHRGATLFVVLLTPLPCWAHLSEEEVQDPVRTMIEEIETEAAVRPSHFGDRPSRSQALHHNMGTPPTRAMRSW